MVMQYVYYQADEIVKKNYDTILNLSAIFVGVVVGFLNVLYIRLVASS